MNPLTISEKLFERYEKVIGSADNYFGILAIFALALTAEAGNNQKLIEKCCTAMLKYPDKINHPRYNFANYKIGGIAQAWLAMKGYITEKNEEIDVYAQMTLGAITDEEGIVCNPHRYPKHVQTWIDSVYAVCPFMLYAGVLTNNDKYIDFSVRQCVKMYQRFMDKSCGLLHQAKGYRRDERLISEDHWSRGNGWGYLGLTEFIQYLPYESKHRPLIEKMFKEHSEAIARYQDSIGFWRQEMTCNTSWRESSGSALFLYGIGVGIRLGILDEEKFRPVFEKGLIALSKCAILENMSTMFCCEGCLSPGDGSIDAYLTEVSPLRDEVHSFGPFMLAMVSAYYLGIEDVETNDRQYFYNDYRKNDICK